jgi:predicted phosphodiesterase
MKVCLISDTHQQHESLVIPQADLLIHCGDFTNRGTQAEFLSFNQWLGSLTQVTTKVVIAGNHDGVQGFQDNYWMGRSLLSNAKHVLNDSGCEVMGLKLWGSPWTPEYGGWSFGYGPREAEVRWSQIPVGLDFLITHGPPWGVQDQTYDQGSLHLVNIGCKHLLHEVQAKAPRYHVFGHNHDPGTKVIGGITFVNASMFDHGNRQHGVKVLEIP